MDDPNWFLSPEHAHIVGVDDRLAEELRSYFGLPNINVDCGVEGTRSYTYHFRISGVDLGFHGRVCDRARDLLAEWTPYRCEVECIQK